nr:hypothetical protein CFP56_14098 [Quercus suber]
MIVTRRKPMTKACDKPSKVSLSQFDESFKSLFEKTSLRAVELERATGKRKAPQSQTAMTSREEGRTNQSHQGKSVDGNNSKRSGSRVNQNQKTKVAIESQRKDLGLTRDSVFIFEASAGPLKLNGPSQGPWLLTKTNEAEEVLKTKSEGAHSNALRKGNNGESRELGNFLQGQNHSDWRSNNTMDKAGSNGGMGVVRFGIDVSVEEYVPVNKGE